MSNAEQALSKAKMRLMLDGGRFISSIVLQMEHKFSELIPTAATNGKEVLYNEDFFMELNEKERVGLIAHEAWHVAFMHNIRRGNRDPLIWNYAGDYVINYQVRDAGLVLPEPHLYDRKYINKTTEEVYDMLMEEYEESGGGLPENILDGDILDATDESMSDEEKAHKEMEVQAIIVKAVTQAQMDQQAGSIPGEINRAIQDLINPKLNWKELLQRFVDGVAKEDYSWRRPNKRYFPEVIMPSPFSETIDHMTVAIDTSGSVSEEMLLEMLSEIQGIYDVFQPKKMVIMDCDWEIHNIHEVQDSNEITTLTFNGGGGTSLHPPVDWAKKQETNVMLYFTDLWAAQIEEEPEFPILWICYSDHDPAPVGETVYYHPEHTH